MFNFCEAFGFWNHYSISDLVPQQMFIQNYTKVHFHSVLFQVIFLLKNTVWRDKILLILTVIWKFCTKCRTRNHSGHTRYTTIWVRRLLSALLSVPIPSLPRKFPRIQSSLNISTKERCQKFIYLYLKLCFRHTTGIPNSSM